MLHSLKNSQIHSGTPPFDFVTLDTHAPLYFPNYLSVSPQIYQSISPGNPFHDTYKNCSIYFFLFEILSVMASIGRSKLMHTSFPL